MASIIKVDQIQTAAGGTPTAADLGINTTGSVLQVVSTTTSSATNNSTTSYVDVLTLSITPKSASSKIFISYTSPTYAYSLGQAFNMRTRLLRDGTEIVDNFGAVINGSGTKSNGYTELGSCMTGSYLDSPSSTSQLTYKVQSAVLSGTPDYALNFHARGTITLLEIAG